MPDNNTTAINNSLTNNDPAAMLFVTHVNNPPGITANGFNLSYGVFYDSGTGRWEIYREDAGTFPVDTTFNVLVIKR